MIVIDEVAALPGFGNVSQLVSDGGLAGTGSLGAGGLRLGDG
ncbi:MAG: hypothetical protein AAGB29_03105 [Planctomycetota bacterium]